MAKLTKLLFILFASILPFLVSLRGDFVFDDSEAILNNKDVVSNVWFSPFYNDFWGNNIKSNTSHKSYRPLTIWSFRLNYLLSGNQFIAYNFKLTNICCHAISCTLLWCILQVILKKNSDHAKWWANKPFLSTLLFAVHPIHVEAVAGIVGRADVLAAIMFFTAFLVYHRAMKESGIRAHVYTTITAICSAFAMLFKENGITVLGFCMLYELVTNITMKKENKKKALYARNEISIRRIMFLVFSAVLLLILRWIIMGGTRPEFQAIDNPAAFADNTFTKIATFNYLYFLNFLLLIWPQWLCYDWSMGCVPLIRRMSDDRILFILLLYVYGILIWRALVSKNNKPSTKRYIIVAISLIAIPFLPAANIFFPVGFVIAERVLYISSAGYCLLISIGLAKIIQRKKLRKICLFFYLMLLLTFTLRSCLRSLDWENELILFTSALSVCPLNAKVRYNVAKVADAKKAPTYAEYEYKKAIESLKEIVTDFERGGSVFDPLYPEYYQAMNNLGNLLRNQEKFLDAEYYLRKATKVKRDFPAAWMNLGILLAQEERFEESYDAYTMALNYRNNYPDCYFNLGNLFLQMASKIEKANKTEKVNETGKINNTEKAYHTEHANQTENVHPTEKANHTDMAMKCFIRAIEISPTHQLSWINLLTLFDNTGRIQKAADILPKAIELIPDSPSLHFTAAKILGQLNRYEEAEKLFKRAIQLYDKKVEANHYNNFGILYHRWEKYDLAYAMYRKALDIDPNFTSAQQNLQKLDLFSRFLN